MKSKVLRKENSISWHEKNTYLYLSWADSNTISGLAISSSPLCLPHIVESNMFNLLDFFASYFFIFSSEFLSQQLHSQLRKSSVIILEKDGISITSNEYRKLSKERASKKREILKDIDEERICPLSHLLLLSRSSDEKQLSSLRLAVEYGFPAVDLVDFDKKIIKAGKKEITSKWDTMTSDQKGSLEKDFVRTLKSALKSLENEHHPLFEKIRSIIPPGDYSEYSLAPLFGLLPYITPKELRTVPIQPKIGIKFLRFEAIFELEEENVSNFIIAMKEKLSSDLLKIIINEMGKFQIEDTEVPDEKYYRARISFILETVSDFIDLEDSTVLVKDLAYLAEEALYEISSESYERFRKHKIPEFWLKNAGIAIEVPSFMINKVGRIVRNNFGSYLDTSQRIKLYRKSKGQVEVVFFLYFSTGYDYVIERRSKGLFPNVRAEDPYTRIGIEYLMRKEFNQALKFFRRAKGGLLRDYLNVTSLSESTRDLHKMRKYWLADGISPEELLSSSNYTDETDPEKILNMLKVTEDWTRTATSLQYIEILEKQIRLLNLNETEFARAMETVFVTLKKTKNRFFKNFFNFIEDIGSFYVYLLQEIEKEAPESVKEWMRLMV